MPSTSLLTLLHTPIVLPWTSTVRFACCKSNCAVSGDVCPAAGWRASRAVAASLRLRARSIFRSSRAYWRTLLDGTYSPSEKRSATLTKFGRFAQTRFFGAVIGALASQSDCNVPSWNVTRERPMQNPSPCHRRHLRATCLWPVYWGPPSTSAAVPAAAAQDAQSECGVPILNKEEHAL